MAVKIFETVMLICFDSPGPFSIYKTWKAKNSLGKSIVVLFTILAGYISMDIA